MSSTGYSRSFRIAKRCGWWAKTRVSWLRIEFEHESRNFLKHMHDVKGMRFDYLLAT